MHCARTHTHNCRAGPQRTAKRSACLLATHSIGADRECKLFLTVWPAIPHRKGKSRSRWVTRPGRSPLTAACAGAAMAVIRERALANPPD